MLDLAAQVEGLRRKTLEDILVRVAQAWADNNFEEIGVILEDYGLTEID